MEPIGRSSMWATVVGGVSVASAAGEAFMGPYGENFNHG